MNGVELNLGNYKTVKEGVEVACTGHTVADELTGKYNLDHLTSMEWPTCSIIVSKDNGSYIQGNGRGAFAVKFRF